MKLNISKQDRMNILEMHRKQKNLGVILEQNSQEKKVIENLLTHFCLKGKGEPYYVENLQRGNTKYEWVIKQIGTKSGNVRYLTLDGHVFEPKDQRYKDENFKWVNNWSLQACEQKEVDKGADALRTYFIDNLSAKTLEDWAKEGVNVYQNPEYVKLDYLGYPPLYIDKRIPIRKSFKAESNGSRLWARLKSQGAKFEHELNYYEKQEMDGPYTLPPDSDFPSGLKYYLPAVGGARKRDSDKTDVRNAYPGTSQAGLAGQSISATQESDPTVTRALDRIRNLEYDKSLPTDEMNECAEVLRTFYNFYNKRTEINIANDDFDFIKRQAQACVYELKPSRFSSVFGARGGDVDRDTRKIIKKLTGEIPGIRQTDPYRLLPRRIKK